MMSVSDLVLISYDSLYSAWAFIRTVQKQQVVSLYDFREYL